MPETRSLQILVEASQKITSFFGLAGFGLVIVLIVIGIAVRRKNKPVPKPAWYLLAFVVSIPLLAFVIQATVPEPIYRITVMVVDPNGVPVPDARVTAAPDCVNSRTEANWRFECSESLFGSPRLLTLTAQWPARSMLGKEILDLGRDRNRTVTIQLKGSARGKVRGVIKDDSGRLVKDANVFFVGYQQQGVRTNEFGEFELDASQVTAQDLRIRVQTAGYQPVESIYPGFGDVSLVVARVRRKGK